MRTILPVIILTFGPPGTGKSTHGQYIAAKLGVPWISSGAVMREEARRDQRIARLLAAGELVPDAEVNGAMLERLADGSKGFVLDGYPRTVPQAESLLRFLQDRSWRIGRIYHFNVPVEVLLERLKDRGRLDDRPEVVRERLHVYKVETEPVIQVLSNAGAQIIDVDNSRPIDEVHRTLDLTLRSTDPRET